ncbi:MAG: hypothetical protein GXO27_06520 [Chlorobi bacterium]|nr:hypothetical protein [Chlorobiota bacterium]
MKLLVFSVLFLLILWILWHGYRRWYINPKLERHLDESAAALKPLESKLKNWQKIAPREVEPFAADYRYRLHLYKLLSDYNRTGLFPSAWLTEKYFAQAYMAEWLHFPTEWNAYPEKLEHLTTVLLIQGEIRVRYHVFRFAGKDDKFYLGVAGPYTEDSIATDHPYGTFSRFQEDGTVSPEEEVRWVHEHITMKK